MKQFTDYEDRFQWFLLPALLLLLVLELLAARRTRPPWLSLGRCARRGGGGEGMRRRILRWWSCPFCVLRDAAARAVGPLAGQRRERSLHDQRFTDAEVNYRKALEKEQDSSRDISISATRCTSRGSTRRPCAQYDAARQASTER